MSEYIGECEARLWKKQGRLIGKTSACSESKGLWFEVYEYDGEFVACVMSEHGVSCGERISSEELSLYMEEKLK